MVAPGELPSREYGPVIKLSRRSGRPDLQSALNKCSGDKWGIPTEELFGHIIFRCFACSPCSRLGSVSIDINNTEGDDFTKGA